jgi:Cys-tRNA(Pro) deacylase
MRTAKTLQTFITEHNLPAEILHLSEDTPTVPDAARVLNVAETQIIKSLVFEVQTATNKTPILVIANGTARVDTGKVAAHLGVGRKRVKFASPSQALEITGYVVGSMPPFGHRTSLRTLLNPGVLAFETVFGGGGDVHAMLKLSPVDLQAITQAEVVSLLAE